MLLVPPHFGTEVANALLRGLGLDAHDVAARLRELFRAGVEVVDRGLIGLLDAIEPAAGHGLSVDDAAWSSTDRPGTGEGSIDGGRDPHRLRASGRGFRCG
jgi:hypothetical protein